MKSKAEIIAAFDPNGVGQEGSLFGLPFAEEYARVVVLPVPWEVTVSYGAGTARGPQAVLDASPQLDYGDVELREAWKLGIYMRPIESRWLHRSNALRAASAAYIAGLEQGEPVDPMHETVQRIDQEARKLHRWLADETRTVLDAGKIPIVLGGDHSTPLGAMQALAAQYPDFGILQIDAHADLREAYEGFQYSHASIMYNALQLPQVTKLVQVGIRDLCPEEQERIAAAQGRIVLYAETKNRAAQYQGKTWQAQCEEIIAQLPQRVYISFDIDGLDPQLCPNTGTPVPGGLQFEEAVHLLRTLVLSGRQIIGADLCEVAPGTDDWDGNVGARILYKLATWAAHAQEQQRTT